MGKPGFVPLSRVSTNGEDSERPELGTPIYNRVLLEHAARWYAPDLYDIFESGVDG